MPKNQEFRASIAPMMDWTDRYCRWFHRRLSARTTLYTEMVVAQAILHGDRDYLLGFDPSEHPLVLQVGGSEPKKLAEAARIGADFGYDEINLNVGCPSDRVQSGRFGACLMATPDLVARCFEAMQEAVSIPVTIKCRLGIDDQQVTSTLPEFVKTVAEAGCERFIIHARKAWLEGLSPKDNRTIPPLDYALVRKMKDQFSHVWISLNGGLNSISSALEAAKGLDGVMFGRSAYQNPWLLRDIDHQIYGDAPAIYDRDDIVDMLIEFIGQHENQDRRAKAIIRHIMGLYANQPGARIWRRTLSEGSAQGWLPSQTIKAAYQARQAQIYSAHSDDLSESAPNRSGLSA